MRTGPLRCTCPAWYQRTINNSPIAGLSGSAVQMVEDYATTKSHPCDSGAAARGRVRRVGGCGRSKAPERWKQGVGLGRKRRSTRKEIEQTLQAAGTGAKSSHSRSYLRNSASPGERWIVRRNAQREVGQFHH